MLINSSENNENNENNEYVLFPIPQNISSPIHSGGYIRINLPVQNNCLYSSYERLNNKNIILNTVKKNIISSIVDNILESISNDIYDIFYSMEIKNKIKNDLHDKMYKIVENVVNASSKNILKNSPTIYNKPFEDIQENINIKNIGFLLRKKMENDIYKI